MDLHARDSSIAALKGIDEGALRDLESNLDTYLSRYFSIISSDDIGLKDYALRRVGARVVSNTPTYTKELAISVPYYGTKQLPAMINSDFLHTWGIDNGVGRPELVIDGGRKLPGDCWPFSGDKGNITIELRKAIFLRSVSLQHISPDIADNDISSAPKDFKVYVSKSLEDTPQEAGSYTYDPSSRMYSTTLPFIKTFPISNAEKFGEVKYVTLAVGSNHGHPSYTCIYRFRAHDSTPLEELWRDRE